MRRTTSTIPFGYQLDNKTRSLIEVPEELAVLEKVLYLSENEIISLRQASEWIKKRTNRKISHAGLLKRLNKERKELNVGLKKRQFSSEDKILKKFLMDMTEYIFDQKKQQIRPLWVVQDRLERIQKAGWQSSRI